MRNTALCDVIASRLAIINIAEELGEFNLIPSETSESFYHTTHYDIL